MKKRIHVAAGVILSPEGQILLALRPQGTHQGGLWEFPGGKVEADEIVEEALIRELQEELAINVTTCEPLVEVTHDYSDKSVLLDVWVVSTFTGEPKGNEGQQIRWVNPEHLADYEFPAANVPIVEAVQQRFCVKV
jgi:8-oxo-dGTP diphosphatase